MAAASFGVESGLLKFQCKFEKANFAKNKKVQRRLTEHVF